MKLRIGYELRTGDPVDVVMSQESPHIVIFGQTALGKTELIKSIVRQISEQETEVRILVFDMREHKPEFAGEGRRLPVYIRESKDPLVLKRLMEAIMGASLKREYATLIRACQGAKDWDDIVGRLDRVLENPKMPGIVRDMALTLKDLLLRLKREMAQVEVADDVDLRPGLNVMPLNERSKEFKQLVVRNTLPLVYKKYRHMVVVLDEAQNLIPQKYSSPATEPVDDYIRTSRGRDDYLVVASQSITGTSKDPLKSAHTWVHLGQATKGEATEAIDYIPYAESMRLTRREMMTMPTGHAVVNTKEWAKRTYIRPTWLPEHVAAAVAKGERTLDEARAYVTAPTAAQDEEEDPMLKERVAELEQALAESNENAVKWERLAKSWKDKLDAAAAAGQGGTFQEVQKRMVLAESEVARLGKELAEAKQHAAKGWKLYEIEQKSFQRMREERDAALAKARSGPRKGTQTTDPPEPGLDIDAVVERVLARLPAEAADLRVSKAESTLEVTIERPVVEADEDSPRGRVALLLADGFFESERGIGDVLSEFESRFSLGRSGGVQKGAYRELEWFTRVGFLRRSAGDPAKWTALPGTRKRVKVRERSA